MVGIIHSHRAGIRGLDLPDIRLEVNGVQLRRRKQPLCRVHDKPSARIVARPEQVAKRVRREIADDRSAKTLRTTHICELVERQAEDADAEPADIRSIEHFALGRWCAE